MKKKIIIASIIGMVFLTGCHENIEVDIPNNEITNTTNNEEIVTKYNDIEFIDGIYGVYGKDDLEKSVVEVFKGKDENHIDISAYFSEPNMVLFHVVDMEITENKDGEVKATKLIGQDETAWDYFVKDQNLENARLDVLIKDNKINLKFNVKTDDFDKEIEKEKINIKAITEENKQKALENILISDFKNIDEEIFEVVHNTDNYLAVRVKSYLYWESPKGKDYGEFGERGFWKSYYIEGSDSIGIGKYYNIDKKNKKILDLNDIIKNVDDVNEYINKEIDKMHDKLEENEEWYYDEFLGIGAIKVFENYFLVEDDKNVVKIRCISHPYNLDKELDDLCIEVPFEYFNLN